MSQAALERRFGPDVRAWQNGNGVMPDWVRAEASQFAPNGTFLIQTPLGRQRVHRSHLVISQAGQIYTCPESEAQMRVDQTRYEAAQATDPKNLIGPGKSVRPMRKKTKAGSRRYPAPRGTPPVIEWAKPDDLLVDPTYQRSIENHASRRLIASIAAHWDWRLCTPLAVSRRQDGKYVIDGQHRLAAARLRGDIVHLPCCVAEYDGPADEAGMFVAANRARRAINRLDDFYAALVAGDEDALEVNRLIQSVGLQVSRHTGSGAWKPGEVAFTSSVQRIRSRYSDKVAQTALDLLAKAFKGQVLTNGASVFLGLARAIGTQQDLCRERLFTVLCARSMADWGGLVRNSRGGDTRAQIIGDALLAAYEETIPDALAA